MSKTSCGHYALDYGTTEKSFRAARKAVTDRLKGTQFKWKEVWYLLTESQLDRGRKPDAIKVSDGKALEDSASDVVTAAADSSAAVGPLYHGPLAYRCFRNSSLRAQYKLLQSVSIPVLLHIKAHSASCGPQSTNMRAMSRMWL